MTQPLTVAPASSRAATTPGSAAARTSGTGPAGSTGPTGPAGPAIGSTGPAATLGTAGLVTVLLGAFLPMLDFFIVNVALPTIDHDLAAGPAVLELVAAGYGIAFAVLLVLGGRLGDSYGRRRLFVIGAVAFALTSLACGLAPGAWSLVAARAAQGASAALLIPQVLGTITAATEGARRGRALSVYGAVGGISVVIGQVLGGMLVAADLFGTGWRSVFLLNVPFALLAVVLAVRYVPESRSTTAARVDVPGTVLLTATLLSLLVPLMEGRAAGWPLWSWVLLALFPVFAVAFGVVERRAERRGDTPLVPPSLLRIPEMRRGLGIALPYFAGFGGFMFVIAVALQQGLRLGPVAAGWALVPMAVGYFSASLAGPRLIGRWGSRVLSAGAVVQATGLATLALTVLADWSHFSPLRMAPGVALAGIGQGLIGTPLFRVVLAKVPAARAGVGSGVLATGQQSSLALGVATLGTLYLSLSPVLGMDRALALCLGIQLLGSFTILYLTTRLPRSIG
ncbi:MFS transporter [Kitasatospora xanthocidica]|uniref:MFS transporter n=1 Tax=Kitasatospora xanthocidica TaxID=83382 RepID=A0A372ZUF4_9ACTN|nr:MFS transporter [Kitasatospora xanthocidica]